MWTAVPAAELRKNGVAGKRIGNADWTVFPKIPTAIC